MRSQGGGTCPVHGIGVPLVDALQDLGLILSDSPGQLLIALLHGDAVSLIGPLLHPQPFTVTLLRIGGVLRGFLVEGNGRLFRESALSFPIGSLLLLHAGIEKVLHFLSDFINAPLAIRTL